MILIRTKSVSSDRSAGGGRARLALVPAQLSSAETRCGAALLGARPPRLPERPACVTQGLELGGGATELVSGSTSGMFVYCLLFTYVC